ncbi:type II toxin-antitoxin system VapC family toxin [uncultured Roseobacter sp.]|uniref:type II toxin-antitoxin system VapC family toxin n=1 Tax=uncultured Roseobacter sp. TaxID=114847 RepID=UPI002611CB49|nr:type II toxin-antitoxin system VapC family toxin [uncultured Roseobacter sp.]
MFLDASAIVAIINREAGFEEIVERIEAHQGKFEISPLVKFEATAAVARSRSGKQRPTSLQFDAAGVVVGTLIGHLNANEVTITAAIGDKALVVAARYGKFVGHEADLNFGDCFAYACAKAVNSPLLYKGDDFAKTDMA